MYSFEISKIKDAEASKCIRDTRENLFVVQILFEQLGKVHDLLQKGVSMDVQMDINMYIGSEEILYCLLGCEV